MARKKPVVALPPNVGQGVTVRWMTKADLLQVLEIDLQSDRPRWDEESFLAEMRRRNSIALCATVEKRIVGCLVYRLVKRRLRLVWMSVDQAFRRRKIGSMMVDKLKSKMALNNYVCIVADVDERDYDALVFLKSQGFMATAMITGQFGRYDGIEMIFSGPVHGVL